MERKLALFTAFFIGLISCGCTANRADDGNAPTQGSSLVYENKGMEISKIISNMADTLYLTMCQDLDVVETDESGNIVRKPLPKVAVTSFVDTDTFENAGYLGRTIAEIFVHELDRRQIPVFEYKVTKGLSVTSDGDFIFSRDWKKLSRQALVKRLLGGTFTRNEEGVVLNARIINMETSSVEGSATGFIPYSLLPYCYRTVEKNCNLNSSDDFKDPIELKAMVSLSKSQSTNKDVNTINDDKSLFNQKYYPNNAQPLPTSSGNYEKNNYKKENSVVRIHTEDPVIYPAKTYQVGAKLVRDVKEESQYERTLE